MTSPRPPARRSRLPALGVGILLVVGALAGATAYTSSQTVQTQQDLTRTLEAQLEATGYASVQSSTYQRGLLNSTQTMNVTLGKGEEKVAVTVINHIQHGPLPGFRAVGNAVVDTEVRFADPALQTRLEKAFGNQKPTIRTVVGLGGATSTHLDVPAGRLTEGSGDERATLSWQPMIGDVQNGGLKSSTRLTWPEFKVASEAGTLTISGMAVDGDTLKAKMDDPLGVGKQMLTLKSATYTAAPSTSQGALSLTDLKVSSASTLSDGFYGGSVQYNIGQLGFSAPGGGAQNLKVQSLKNVQFHLSLGHLSQEPLARIMTTIQTLGQQARGDGETPDLTEAQQQALTDDALALLRGGPIFAIDRLSLTQPSGDIVLTGKVEVPGASDLDAETAQMLVSSPALALGMVKVQAQLKAAEPALQELLGTLAPDAAAGIESLIDIGYLERQGNDLVSNLAFGGGEATVNGQALGGGF
ncbi:YdgA family protein [Deinococcus arenicola]|uniref:YdgA family protein n=1 Tax=Deinococcus arenicola TaxID=2994950 RepID=A0ABU4DPV0_9DEIO|nr:YdgA family protein [Deinococcus sp. ZS9-10]MDV6374453.1 YdgA family protein [Deinococcus sp. ZS9-10]